MIYTIEAMHGKTYPLGLVPIRIALGRRGARGAFLALLAAGAFQGMSGSLPAAEVGQGPAGGGILPPITDTIAFEVSRAQAHLSLNGSLGSGRDSGTASLGPSPAGGPDIVPVAFSAATGNAWSDLIGFPVFTAGDASALDQASRSSAVSSARRPGMASAQDHVIVVPLGLHGGEVTLTRGDDGSYVRGSTPISHGDSVTGSNGHVYRLFLADGEWFSAPVVASISILLPNHQGSIAVSRFEDGSYYHNGAAVANGDSITVGGVEYVLALDGFQGTVSAMDAPSMPDVPKVRPVDDQGNTFDTLQTYVGTRPQLMGSEGSGTQEGSYLGVVGRAYALDDLFAEGSVTEEKTFVSNARSDIIGWLTSIEVLLDLYEPSASGGIDENIERLWDQIAERISQLFPDAGGEFLGDETPKRSNGTTIDAEDVLEDINDALDALEGVDQFEDALDDGVFADASVEEDRIEEVFSATESSERLGFGWTNNTRFGAYARQAMIDDEESLGLLEGDEGLGAFAYSPLDRTATIQLPTSGTASYSGQTVAASGLADHGIYRGPIDLDVDFRSRRVSGQILYLEDSDGMLWTYGGDDLESILLPNARISPSDGSFATAADSVAIADLIPFAGGLTSVELSADVNGRFLGSGDHAGVAAIGTWELQDEDGVLLTGAFGTERDSAGAGPPPPAIPEDSAARTSFIAMPDADGDIEIAARDSDDDRIQLSAATLLRNRVAVVSGDRLFAVAEARVREQLRVLDLFEQLDDNSTSLRDSIWSSANTTLSENIFGSDSDAPVGADYPSEGSLAERDRRALLILDDVLEALGGPDEFRDSLSEDGVFEGLLGSESDLAELDFFGMYDAREYEVEVQFGSSEFTRFGAWAKFEPGYAVSSTRESFGTDEYSDVFAYSPLEQTGYRTGDPNFPNNFTSTYSGQTRGVNRAGAGSGPEFYFGDMAVTVQWGGSPENSSVSAAILDLVDAAGRPFAYRGGDVFEIVFTGLMTEADSDLRLGFSGSPTVRVRYEDSTRGETGYAGTRTLAGKFIGKQVDGPLGVIGTWELGDIKGAYGADVAP